MRIILFGFKKCGKTHFGKLLAETLKFPFIDTDHLIEERHGKTCRTLALELGESSFRALEKEIIFSLNAFQAAVISLGGGAVLDPENRDYLTKSGCLVSLHIDKAVLKKRHLTGELPSFLDPQDPEGSFEKMYSMRKPIYDAISAIQVDVTEKSDTEVLNLIKEGLASYGQ